MPRQRLLDILQLTGVAKGVLEHHLKIRNKQWQVYKRGSSVIKYFEEAGTKIVNFTNVTSTTYGVTEEPAQPIRMKVENRTATVKKRSGEMGNGHSQRNLPLIDPLHGGLEKNQTNSDIYYLRTARMGLVLDSLLQVRNDSKVKAIKGNLDSNEVSAGRVMTTIQQNEGTISKIKDAKENMVDRVKLEEGKEQEMLKVRKMKVNKLPISPGHPDIQKSQSSNPETAPAFNDTPIPINKEANIPIQLDPSLEQLHKMNSSRMPSSRFRRLWHYGGLATGMMFGALSESVKRAAGMRSGESLLLNKQNVERLVKKLSKMRGAALKLGQILSIQDSKELPPEIHEILIRVQDSADYMPAYQRDSVLKSNLGSDWRDLFSEFTEVPIAAASIGQVHAAVFKPTGMPVAVKIQYPGVKNSIDSDLNNLAILLTASNLLPKGLYLDKTIANSRIELAWECDYVREAGAIKRFRELLSSDKDREVFSIPQVIEEASNAEVLTMERMWGIAVIRSIPNLTQEQKDFIGSAIYSLALREVAQFKYMQTDPNWTNFLWNPKTNKVELLDFGASRPYSDSFVQLYASVLCAAARGDREACHDISIKLGYLTGLESPTMLKAHVDSIITLAEPFSENAPEVYEFKNQSVTDRVRALIPVMLRERLSPPPEETYSLHRKLSGVFLLCARLGSRVRCKDLFREVMGEGAKLIPYN